MVCTLVTPTVEKLRQNCEFKAKLLQSGLEGSLYYIISPSLKKQKNPLYYLLIILDGRDTNPSPKKLSDDVKLSPFSQLP